LGGNENVHLIFVNDGSNDHSEKLLLEIKSRYPEKLEIVYQEIRTGKAEAIRAGMLRGLNSGAYSYFGFIDADLAVPLTDIVLIAEKLKEEHRNMGFGIRTDVNKINVHRTLIRKAMGNLFKAYLHRILKFHVADSQCGAKVFAAGIVPALYQAPFQTRWLSDIELLIRYGQCFKLKREDVHTHVTQVPVSKFEDKAHSKFNAIELLRVIRELMIVSLL
jgi:glycosyltransferase involved in cell wall biosynthesis